MATKEAYQKKLEAQLKEWDAMLDQMIAKSQKATAEARIKYENDLEGLKRNRETAHQMLAEMGKRTENAWEDMKDGAERIWGEMRKTMEKVSAHLK